MDAQALSQTELRIIIAVVGVIAFALIYFFGRPRKPGQGKRRLFERDSGERVEPTLGEVDTATREPGQGELGVGMRDELDKLGSANAPHRTHAASTPAPQGPAPGR